MIFTCRNLEIFHVFLQQHVCHITDQQGTGQVTVLSAGLAIMMYALTLDYYHAIMIIKSNFHSPFVPWRLLLVYLGVDSPAAKKQQLLCLEPIISTST